MFGVLNLIVKEYSKYSLNQMFLQSVKVEIVEISKQNILKTTPQYYIPKEDVLYLRGKCLCVIKVHSSLSISNCEEILENGGIIVARDGCLSVNSFNINIKNVPIQAIIIALEYSVLDGDLNTYTSLLEHFHHHLSLQFLKYKSHQINFFQNMFLDLESVPQQSYFRILPSSPHRRLVKDLDPQTGGRYWQSCNLECYFCINTIGQKSMVDFYHNYLPMVENRVDLSVFQAIKKNYKYSKKDVSLGRHTLELKTRNFAGTGSFVCLVNIKADNYKQALSELEVFFKQMVEQLLILGVGNAKEQTMIQNLEDIKTICKLLDIEQTGLINRFIL